MKKENLIKIAKTFRKEIIKNFGEKCKDYDFGCVVCNAHRVVDNLEELAGLLEALDKDKPAHKHLLKGLKLKKK